MSKLQLERQSEMSKPCMLQGGTLACIGDSKGWAALSEMLRCMGGKGDAEAAREGQMRRETEGSL